MTIHSLPILPAREALASEAMRRKLPSLIGLVA
jgi:hypothetical protein